MIEINPILIQPEIALRNRYEDGEVVFERIRPSRKLIVSSFSNGLYYCELLGGQVKKPLVYSERELRSTITATDEG